MWKLLLWLASADQNSNTKNNSKLTISTMAELDFLLAALCNPGDSPTVSCGKTMLQIASQEHAEQPIWSILCGSNC
jgi:hypothetical protein